MSKFIYGLVVIFIIVIFVFSIFGITKLITDHQKQVCIDNGGKVITDEWDFFERCFYDKD